MADHISYDPEVIALLKRVKQARLDSRRCLEESRAMIRASHASREVLNRIRIEMMELERK